jgi:hypothetical protein
MMKANSQRQSWVRSDGKQRKSRRNRFQNNSQSTIGKQIDRRVSVYQNAGVQALRDLNSLRRFVNAEFHDIDVAVAQVNSTTTATFSLLNGLQVGDTVATRTGQSIKMDRMYLRYYINSNATSIQNIIRFMIVLDKQPNSAIFAIGDLLTATTPTAPLTFGSQNRFVVIYDQIYALSSNGQGCVCDSLTLPTNQHVIFNTGNAGTVADINSNSLYAVHFSDQLANPPTITFSTRVWFVDN